MEIIDLLCESKHVLTGRAALLLARLLYSITANVTLVFLVSLLILSRFANASWTSYNLDSFTMQYDSVRILYGEVPYRDFFNFPTPGTYWLQAAVFSIFGVKSLSAVWLLIIFLAVLGAALYLLAYFLTRRPFMAWFAPLFVLLALPAHFPWPYHQWYVEPVTICTLLVSAWWLQEQREWKIGLAGVVTAFAWLFVQTQGAALGVAILASMFLKTATETTDLLILIRVYWKRLIWFAGGIILVMLPVALYFLFVGGLREMMYDTIIWPSQNYMSINRVPFIWDFSNWEYWGISKSSWATTQVADNNPWAFYSRLWMTFALIIVPVIALLFSIVHIIERSLYAVRVWYRRTSPATTSSTGQHRCSDSLLFCNITYVILFVSVIYSRSDMIHVVWATILAYPVLLGFISTAHSRKERDSFQFHSPILGIRLLLTSLIIAAGVWFFAFTNTPSSSDVDDFAGTQPLITYIRANTTDTDTIAVLGLGGHPYFYGRRSAIGYTFIVPPGQYTTQSQMQQVANEIMKKRPKLVLFQFGDDWSTYFSFSPEILQFACENYGGPDGSVVPAKLNIDEGDYFVYFRR